MSNGSNGSNGAQFAPMPIIVGSPRSGTTLLRFMLDAHPQLAIPPETGFLSIGQQFEDEADNLREKFYDAMVNFPPNVPNWPDYEIPRELFWATLIQIEPFKVAAGYRAFYQLYAAKFDKPRWGDKTPLYCHSLDAIRKILPEARFIHIIRDGRDASLSLRKMWFSPGADVESQAAYWRDFVTAARDSGLDHADYLEVRYEKLILNTQEVLAKICKFIDLEYDAAMLSYYTRVPMRLKEHKGRYRPDGAEIFSQERRLGQQRRTMEPPDPACIFAWKSVMSMEERIRFQHVAGDLLRELDYEV